MESGSSLRVSLSDPLSTITRSERRMLLGISGLSILVAKAGLVPTKISALGIELEKTDQRTLVISLAFVVLYFAVAFILYGLSDLLAWRLSYIDGSHAEYRAFYAQVHRKESKESPPSPEYYPTDRFSDLVYRLAHPASFVRALFEFLFPILVAGYTVWLLAFGSR